MSKQRGEVFHIAGRISSRHPEIRPPGIPAVLRAPGPVSELDNLTDAWPLFKWSFFAWFWQHRNDGVKVWGPIRFKFRRVRGLVERALGPCPFDWKKGPAPHA